MLLQLYNAHFVQFLQRIETSETTLVVQAVEELMNLLFEETFASLSVQQCLSSAKHRVKSTETCCKASDSQSDDRLRWRIQSEKS